jgi:hypothetical protein
MSSLLALTSTQLKRAAALKDRIAKLEKQLNAILGGSAPAPAKAAKSAKRKMSKAGRARIAAAQRARWAKQKAGK